VPLASACPSMSYTVRRTGVRVVLGEGEHLRQGKRAPRLKVERACAEFDIVLDLYNHRIMRHKVFRRDGCA